MVVALLIAVAGLFAMFVAFRKVCRKNEKLSQELISANFQVRRWRSNYAITAFRIKELEKENLSLKTSSND